MEKFLFIIREDLNKLKQWNEEQRFNAILEMDKWVKSLVEKGNYLSGDALRIAGSYVSKNQVLSDGPFIEAKEGISGIIVMEAADMRDAVSLAQTCTFVKSGDMAIEVRPMMELKDIREFGDEGRTTSSR